jgi:polyhydroxybutyrate depolymerase
MLAARWLLAVPLITLWTAGTAEAAGSPGCGRPPPASIPDHVVLEGRERNLIADIPAGYDPRHPHRLVVAFHGRTNDNAQVRAYYGLEQPAGDPTIFVYPLALRQADGTFSWSDPGDKPDSLRDYALFDTIVAKFAEVYCVDPDRIFVVGHSLGASFVNSLACARGEVLRAVGSVAGGVNRSDCRGAVAALLFHNPHDRLVAYDYGLEARDLFRAHNRALSAGGRTLLGGFACREYRDPAAVNPVVWCPHTRDRSRHGRYYPHHWPAGTGAAMMAFFEALPAAATASAATALVAAPGG